MLCGFSTGQIATTFARSMPAPARAPRRAARSFRRANGRSGTCAAPDARRSMARTAATTSSIRHEWNSSRFSAERLAVVAKIQPEDVEAGGVQSGAERTGHKSPRRYLPSRAAGSRGRDFAPGDGVCMPSSRTPSPQSTISRRAAASSPRARRRKSPCRSGHAGEQRLDVPVAQAERRAERAPWWVRDALHRNRLWRQSFAEACSVKLRCILLHNGWARQPRCGVLEMGRASRTTIITNASQ